MTKARLTQVEADYLSRFLKRGRLKHSQKEALLREAVPPHLLEIRGRLRERMPQLLLPDFDEVLVLSPPDATQLLAEARAWGPRSRAVLLSKPTMLAAGLVGTASSIFIESFPRDAEDLIRNRDRAELSRSAEYLALADGWGRELAGRRRNVLLGEAKRLLGDLIQQPEAIAQVAGRWLRFPFANAHHLLFADTALEFTLAHELAHHLLQHEAPQRGHTPPARALLRDWLSTIGYDLPESRRSHQHEFEADALAWRLMTGDPELTRDLSWWIGMTGAAFGALALYDQIEAAAGPLGRGPDTHPPISSRAAVLFDLLYLTSKDQVAETYSAHHGRTISGRPVHFAMQLWALRGFLAAVETSPLWLPGEVPARTTQPRYGLARLAVVGHSAQSTTGLRWANRPPYRRPI